MQPQNVQMNLAQTIFTARKDYLSALLPELRIRKRDYLEPPNSPVTQTGLRPRSINPSIQFPDM